MTFTNKAVTGPITWGTLESTPVKITNLAQSGTASGNFFSLITENLKIILDGKTDSLQATNFSSVKIPVHLDKKKNIIGFISGIRGHISKSKGAISTIYLNVGGESVILSSKCCDPEERDFYTEVYSPADYYNISPSKENLSISALILGQRTSVNEDLHISIDSVDIQAIFGGDMPNGKTKKK